MENTSTSPPAFCIPKGPGNVRLTTSNRPNKREYAFFILTHLHIDGTALFDLAQRVPDQSGFLQKLVGTGPARKKDVSCWWPDVCLAYPAIEAEKAGCDVYAPEDVVGSMSQLSHEYGMKRMISAGVEPITWNVVPAELQRDYARSRVLPEVTAIFMEYLFKVDPNTIW